MAQFGFDLFNRYKDESLGDPEFRQFLASQYYGKKSKKLLCDNTLKKRYLKTVINGDLCFVNPITGEKVGGPVVLPDGTLNLLEYDSINSRLDTSVAPQNPIDLNFNDSTSAYAISTANDYYEDTSEEDPRASLAGYVADQKYIDETDENASAYPPGHGNFAAPYTEVNPKKYTLYGTKDKCSEFDIDQQSKSDDELPKTSNLYTIEFNPVITSNNDIRPVDKQSVQVPAQRLVQEARRYWSEISNESVRRYYQNVYKRDQISSLDDFITSLKPHDDDTHAVCFTPTSQSHLYESQCSKLVRQILDRATTSIKVSTYQFSNRLIVGGILMALKRRVKVEIIVDRAKLVTAISKENLLICHIGGAEIYFDCKSKMHHNKYLVVDHKVVVTGSYNLSENSVNNAENVIIHNCTLIASSYYTVFDKLKLLCVKYSTDNDTVPVNCCEGDKWY